MSKRSSLMRLVWVAGLACTTACLVGCSDEDDITPAPTTTATGGSGGSAGSGGDAGSAGAPVGDSLEIEVVTAELGVANTEQPVAGAIVAFDMPNGERVEEISGDDGRITFDAVDWSAGTSGALTAYLEGHIVWTYLHLTPTTVQGYIDRLGTEVLTLYMAEGIASDMVSVSGTASNMMDEAHRLLMSSTVPCTLDDGVGPNWALSVAAGEAFSLVTLEYQAASGSSVSARGAEFELFQWAELAHDAVTTETTGVALDMQNALTPTDVSGSFAIPDHGDSDFFDTSRGHVQVSSVGSRQGAYLGVHRLIDVSQDGTSMEYDVQHVSPAAVTLPMTMYQLYDGQQAAAVLMPGYPSAGALGPGLPEPVQLPDGNPVYPWGQAVAWQMNATDAADPDLGMQSWIFNSQGANVWYVGMPPGTTEMTLPELPSGVDANTALGGGNVQGVIMHCSAQPDDAPEYQGLCHRLSTSRTYTLLR